MTTLPDTVLIGPIPYTVKEIEDLHCLDGDGKKKWLHGQIIYPDATIKVADDQTDDMKIATLWHEILHGMMDQAGVDNHPEPLVRMLGYGLVRLIRDNPALVRFTVGKEVE